MYAYTRDGQGHYCGHVCGVRITAHNKASFYKRAAAVEEQARQAFIDGRRQQQVQTILRNESARRSSWM
jgi:hypothetical protein